jgi:alkanesulfonate monooxygenase SsuD/methylene tetrahydromethanopterin reductase-like flavin-dependent oxidoreductase (luciferase family)
MVKLGYKLISEEHSGTDLVRNAMHAVDAGFDFAAISDHFSPWLEEQGHAPLAWLVLGTVAHATWRIGLMTAVSCPTMRYHPAIVTQGAGSRWGLAQGNASTSTSQAQGGLERPSGTSAARKRSTSSRGC